MSPPPLWREMVLLGDLHISQVVLLLHSSLVSSPMCFWVALESEDIPQRRCSRGLHLVVLGPLFGGMAPTGGRGGGGGGGRILHLTTKFPELTNNFQNFHEISWRMVGYYLPGMFHNGMVFMICRMGMWIHGMGMWIFFFFALWGWWILNNG
jgi:hypothetical protein